MRVSYQIMYDEFVRVLLKYGFSKERAELAAKLLQTQVLMVFIPMD